MHHREVRIMIVEDNPGDVDLFLETLGTSTRAIVTVAEDGEQAVTLLETAAGAESSTRPDLIILDWDLPRKSGSEVLVEIKAHKCLRHIPVVVMTSSQSPRDLQAIYTLGASCCVVKPIALDQLMRVMQVMENFWLMAVTYCEEIRHEA
jgi:CheY-like chemotaxis protein